MNTVEIIYMVTMGCISIVTIILNRYQSILIERYKKMLDEKYKNDDVVLDFALRSILKTALENEDYECAQRAVNAIEKLNEAKAVANGS